MNAILFQPTGVTRPMNYGEWGMEMNGSRKGEMFMWTSPFQTTVAYYPIYTRHEIPKEVAQRMMEEAERG